jgi:hypothetical protein
MVIWNIRNAGVIPLPILQVRKRQTVMTIVTIIKCEIDNYLKIINIDIIKLL